MKKKTRLNRIKTVKPVSVIRFIHQIKLSIKNYNIIRYICSVRYLLCDVINNG